jgi:hypothetical protein
MPFIASLFFWRTHLYWVLVYIYECYAKYVYKHTQHNPEIYIHCTVHTCKNSVSFIFLFLWKWPLHRRYIHIFLPPKNGALLYKRYTYSVEDRSRIHEHTISLRFLGIILRVLRLEVSGLILRVFRLENCGQNLEVSPTWGCHLQCLRYKPVWSHFCSRVGDRGHGVKSFSRGDGE